MTELAFCAGDDGVRLDDLSREFVEAVAVVGKFG